jgi:protein-S-isoprenylcysteine O-methyltransferase Ste14
MILSDRLERQGAWLFKYRGVLPIFILVIGVFLFFKTELARKPILFGETNFETMCLLISIAGFAIRIYTVGFSARNTSGRNTEEQVADVLNTKGIYSIVRNPLYLGNFFMWFGLALLSYNFWFIVSFILFYILYYERIIYTEEAYLKRKFGTEYIDWAAKTPCIIPAFKLFSKNEYSFNWKKVLWQEKTGFLLLFTIYTGFNIGGKLVQKRSDFNWIFISGSVLSLLFYVILKISKSRFKNLRS